MPNLADQPHTCCGQIFSSHDTLAFHIVREHLVTLDMVPKCKARCEMLVESVEQARKEQAHGRRA